MDLALVNRYTVLTRDNIDEIAQTTTLSVVELSEKMRQCELFGFTQVYWTTGDDYWYSVRLDAPSIEMWGLDRLVYEAKQRAELF